VSGRSIRLEELVSVSELTKEANRHAPAEPVTVRQMKYRLKLLDARVRRQARSGGGDPAERWGVIVRLSESPTGKIFVRKSALKKHAPELFELDLATGHEVAEIRRDNEILRKKQNAMAAELRDQKAFRRRAEELLLRLTKSDQK
jgi:hypothetical protein